MARQLRPAQLQPVERAFPRQWCAILAAGRQLAGQYRHRRVMPQLVVIDQVFEAQRHTKHALPDQRHHFVLDQLRCPQNTRQTAQPGRSPGRSLPTATHPRPRSSGRRQTRPPRHAFGRVQNQTDPRYTLSASGVPLALRQTVGTTRFSQIRDPDALTLFEKSGLGRQTPLLAPVRRPRSTAHLGAASVARALGRDLASGFQSGRDVALVAQT